MNKFAKILVGNLVSETSKDTISELFHGADGTVTAIVLPVDERSGRGKGYAFVQMASQLEAEQAILKLDGSLLNGRRLCLSLSESEAIKRKRGWAAIFGG